MSKIVALLPMKGNSERVPNKNMKQFDGAPLYHAVAKSLLGSKFISCIAIDTDSAVIAKDALNHFGDKVRIVDRPKRLCGDFVSMNEIIGHDISEIEYCDHFLQTHSTNPLLTTSTIDAAVEFYFSSIGVECDSVFSVTRLQARLYDRISRPINHNPNELRRTQDLDPLYEENSNFYLFSRSSYIKADNNRIGLKPKLFEVNKLEAVDIDEPEDFVLAELLFKKIKG